MNHRYSISQSIERHFVFSFFSFFLSFLAKKGYVLECFSLLALFFFFICFSEKFSNRNLPDDT